MVVQSGDNTWRHGTFYFVAFNNVTFIAYTGLSGYAKFKVELGCEYNDVVFEFCPSSFEYEMTSSEIKKYDSVLVVKSEFGVCTSHKYVGYMYV